MRLVLTALALTLALPVAAVPTLSWAASFDCNRARAPDEKAICANTALNDKDVKMSVLYEVNKRTLAMGGRGVLIDAQQQWLHDRRSCGANRACLNRAYDRRLGELERGLERIYRNGPF
ncbi:lysozyme inhibitor LprI family protein [Caulobacter sp. UNC279MFTsu5.1]|uniref:lysozyme inhibitor LprI family protein n=1 Tax=Caulobacter sp. UNC279MFTsu5.1 TaxID=1502775 RepID=UPI0008EAEAEC|nr:hypothetical protein [Caulobacter sp. UNC279MFTsu5.1]SFJ63978.1 hypothetical protein SAMN02799626_02224 [Caulobacter sp. UNC279MFTsu5.1]